MLFRVVVCSFENEATTWFKSLPLDGTLLQTFHGHVHALASITNLIGSLLVSMVTRCRRKPDKCPSAETKKNKKKETQHKPFHPIKRDVGRFRDPPSAFVFVPPDPSLRFYRVSPSFTGFDRVLLGYDGFHSF